MLIRRFAVAMLAPVLAAAPLAGGAAPMHPARTIVQTDDGPPLAAVELWFRASSMGFGSDPRIGIAQVAAESVAASQGHGEPLAALVQDRGGHLQIATFSDSVQISAIVPGTAAAEIARAMLDDYTRPALTEDGFKRARASVAIEATESQVDPNAQLRERLFGALFSQGPDHYAVLPTVKQLGTLTYPEIVAFAKRAFRAENAVAVVAGVHDSAPILSALGGANAADPAESPVASSLVAAPETVRGESAAGPALGFAFAGPPIADRRAATAMDFLSDYLLAPNTGALSQAVKSVAPAATVNGQFITLHDPGIFLIEVVGDASESARNSVAQALQVVQKPLDSKAFEAAKRAYLYHVLHDLQSTQAQADNLGWYAIEGSPAYAPFSGGTNDEYLKLARGLTPDYVAQVAHKYLSAMPAVALLTPRPSPTTPQKGSSK